MKFAAADGASGGRQNANGPADTDREEITKEHGHQDHDADEGQGLPVQLWDTGIGASLLDAALDDHGPVDFGEGAESADHLDLAAIDFVGETNRFGASQILRHGFDLGHHLRAAAEIGARHEAL